MDLDSSDAVTAVIFPRKAGPGRRDVSWIRDRGFCQVRWVVATTGYGRLRARSPPSPHPPCQVLGKAAPDGCSIILVLARAQNARPSRASVPTPSRSRTG